MDRRSFLVEAAVAAGLMSAASPHRILGDEGGREIVTPVLRCDRPNGNRRIYPRAVVEAVVARFDGEVMGTMGVLEGTGIPLAKVSHVVRSLSLDGNLLMAHIRLLDTPDGVLLRKLLPNTAFRTSGVGNGHCDSAGVMTIGDSYRLITVVALPRHEAATL